MTVRSEGTTTRGHGDGSLFMRRQGRGKGRWVAVVTQRDGRRASRTAKTREEAKAALAELLRLRDAMAPVTRNIRLSDYLERWVSDVAVAPSTRRKHETLIRVHLVPELGHIRLSELRVVDVDLALQRFGRRDGLGPQSVRHVRATLRRALADAVRDGLVTRNVGGLARPTPLPHSERHVLDANQARVLIESTKGTTYGPLWTLLVTTGLRISEALGLSWSDVELGGNDATKHASVSASRGDVLRSGGTREASPARRSGDAPGVGGLAGNLSRPRGSTSYGAGYDVAASKAAAPSITIRRQLARENGEWVHRPPKTAKGRRTIPLTALGVEALRAQRTQQREWISEWFAKRGPAFATNQANHSLRAYYGGDDGRGPGDGRRVAHADARGGGGGSSGAPRGDSPVTPIDTLVFTTSRGKPLHETNTLAQLHKDLAAAGLPRVSQHSLRHAAATILFAQGLPIEAIADMLGHSTVRITQDLYRHSVQSFSVLAAERMQEALGG